MKTIRPQKKSSCASMQKRNRNIGQQEIELVRVDEMIFCSIDRVPVQNVRSYAITNDGNGQTNLVLTIELKADTVSATIRERNEL